MLEVHTLWRKPHTFYEAYLSRQAATKEMERLSSLYPNDGYYILSFWVQEENSHE